MNTIVNLIKLIIAWLAMAETKPSPPKPKPAPEPQPQPQPQPEPMPTPNEPAPQHQPTSPMAKTCTEGEFIEIPLPTSAPIRSGKITFSLQGLNSAAFRDSDAWLFMLMGKTHGGAEYNLQFHIYRDGHNSQIRLISQRHDDYCAPRQFCEGIDGIDRVNTDVEKVYTCNIEWPVYSDDRGYRVFRMDIPDIGVWEIPYSGDLHIIEYARVGNGVFNHGGYWPGQDAPLIISNVAAIWA